MDSQVNLLAISGSLRRTSLNTMLLRAASALAPAGASIAIYERMSEIPLFNPDLDGSEPVPVLLFRQAVAAADGVLISSPEYAHGMSGVMKNALDWLVSSGELSFGKPVAVLNASYSSEFADAQIREVLRTMDAAVVKEACISVPVQGRKLTEEQLIADDELGIRVKAALEALIYAIEIRTSRTARG